MTRRVDVVQALCAEPRTPVALSKCEEAGVAARPLSAASDAPANILYTLPGIYPEYLGDRAFSEAHGARFCYVVGEMARGLATPRMVIAAVRAGLVGFYGSAGLSLDDIRAGVAEIKAGLAADDVSWGANLIHSPQHPGLEAATIDLFLEAGLKRVSASAFMKATPDVARFTALGLSRNSQTGAVERANHVFAKVSRAEVAEQFMSPPGDAMLRDLVASGGISEHQAELAATVPIAAEITAEADSGGHTDNRPAGVLFASLAEARDRVAARAGVDANAIRIGLAGGVATPRSVAAAYQMGAAYVVTGSINQCAVESGLSDAGKRLLADAGPADVMMAPAADMFEQGVQVQVLKRGTLFAMRAKKLYALYRTGLAFEAMADADRAFVETLLGEPFDAAWRETRAYLERTAPKTAALGDRDGNKRFALVARRYLFLGAQWARDGAEARRADFQIWCGPAMGAFNDWVAGTPLEPLEQRTVRQIAFNLLEGAAQAVRAQQLRACGVPVSPNAFDFTPRLFA